MRITRALTAYLLVALVIPTLLVAVPSVAFAETQSECLNRGGNWTANLGADGFSPDGTGTCAAAGASITAGYTGSNAPTKCSGLWNYFTSPITCTGRAMSAIVGAALVTVSAWILQIVGVLFNWLVYYTVIAYGDSVNGFLTTQVLDGISKTWTVFRDISNILIIGLFTFIALSIILGLKQFDAKRMIARVLIIAILINFSLLFTKMIVDGSNFFAYQFYTAVGTLGTAPANNQFPGAATVVDQSVTFTQDGVAGKFIRFMGISSIGNTFTSLRDGADNADNGFIALLHGIFAATVLLGAAAVLAYGCVLLVTRAIVIVFLLITSSLAFASFLIPQFSTSGIGDKYGWNAWWSALIRSAVFAPLLMMFLWATLAVASAIQPAGGTLGGLLQNPSGAGNLSALFAYIIVLGLLFASLKISSSFAGTIGGFNFGTGLAKMAGLAPIALTAGVAGAGLRGYFGGRAAKNSLNLDERIKNQKQVRDRAPDALRFQENQKLLSLMKQKGKADRTATREFNFENTTLGKALQKVGMPAVPGTAKGGFAGPRKAAAEEAAKSAAPLVTTNKDAEEAAHRHIKDQQTDDRARIEKQRSTNAVIVNAAKTMAETAKQSAGLQAKHDEALRSAVIERSEATKEKVTINDMHSKGTIDRAEKDSQITTQDNRIKTANAAVKDIVQHMKSIDEMHESLPHVVEAQKQLDLAESQKSELDSKLTEGVKDVTRAIVENSVKNAQDFAVETAHGDRYTSRLARELTKKAPQKARLKDRIKAEKEVDAEVADDAPDAPPPRNPNTQPNT